MKTMKSTNFAFAVVALVAAATVLFVGGVQPAVADEPSNPFAGTWSGTFARAVDGANGTLEWTFSDSGRLTGTGHHNVLNLDLTFVGHVGSDGKCVIVGFQVGGESGLPHVGEAVINGAGQLVATVTAAWDNSLQVVATLDPVS
jgi:hypothetical protein